jgi:hypothetical protein
MAACFSGITTSIRNIFHRTDDAAPAGGGGAQAQPAPQAQAAQAVRPRGCAAFLRGYFRANRQADGGGQQGAQNLRLGQLPAMGLEQWGADLTGALEQVDGTNPNVPLNPQQTAAAGGAGQIQEQAGQGNAGHPSGVLDLRDVAPEAGSLGSVASSHAAVLVRQGEDVYRVKFNHHGPAATFHEVLAARMNRFLFPSPHAPDVKFGAHTAALPPMQGKYTGVGIASKMVEGFQDWGDFLVREKDGACAALAHVAPDDRPAYRQLLDQYRETQQQIAAFRAGGHDARVSALLKAPKQPFRNAPADAVKDLEPLRQLSRQALQLQDKMLALLPPAFHQALVKALYESEALGNWDYANHERANVGFVIRDGKLAGATAVDFGVCGHTGFSGKPKTESGASIAIPARVDDPFLTLPGRKAKDSEYLPGAVLDRTAVTDFTKVSPSAGVVGSLPRSASFAAIMKQIVSDETEYGIKPAPMLQTARQLAQVTRQDVRQLVRALCEECRASSDPNMGAMLNEVDQTPDQIADSYYQRFQAIVRRAGATEPSEEGRRKSI